MWLAYRPHNIHQVSHLLDANIITCKMVFTLKYNLIVSITYDKVLVVPHGFTQAYDINYIETFPLIVQLNSIHILLSDVGYFRRGI